MNTIATKDGTQIYYKDWGLGLPVAFSHGWPLSSDSWEAQMLASSKLVRNAKLVVYPGAPTV
jgi:pimeloyl-ACP methyl ester carboxylesterase